MHWFIVAPTFVHDAIFFKITTMIVMKAKIFNRIQVCKIFGEQFVVAVDT